jgi:hypothetical protein
MLETHLLQHLADRGLVAPVLLVVSLCPLISRGRSHMLETHLLQHLAYGGLVAPALLAVSLCSLIPWRRVHMLETHLLQHLAYGPTVNYRAHLYINDNQKLSRKAQ